MLDVARTFPATNQRCQQPTGAGKMIFPAPVFMTFVFANGYVTSWRRNNECRFFHRTILMAM